MYTTPEMESTFRVPLAGTQHTNGMFVPASALSQSFSAIALPTVTRPGLPQVSSTSLPRISVTGDVVLGIATPQTNTNHPTRPTQGVGELDHLVTLLCDNFTYERERVGMQQDPMKWSPSEVQIWLSWAIKEFHLENVDRENFYVDGRALCAMSQQEFLSRTPQFMGDILYAHIQHLRSASSPPSQATSTSDEIDHLVQCLVPEITVSSHLQPPPSYSPDTPPKSPSNEELLQYDSSGGLSRTTSRTSLVPPAYRQVPSPSSSASSCHSALTSPHGSPCASPAPPGPSLSVQAAMSAAYTESSGPIQLWQFLLELLTDKKNMDCIVWTGREWEFKLTDPELVAQRWGKRKNKPKMNYEKLSRGLRYYYDKNIIHKVPGKRYVYKFVCDLESLLGCSATELQARYHSKVPETFPQQEQLHQSMSQYTYTTALPSMPVSSHSYTAYWQPSGLSSSSLPATYFA